MSATSPNRPLVLAMAQVGYEHMVRMDNLANHSKQQDWGTWDAQTQALRDEWEGCARAMLDVVLARHHVPAEIVAPVEAPPLPDPPRPCWLAVRAHPHPTWEGEVLYRLEYEANPRVYDKGRAERDRLIERVQLPADFTGGLLAAVEWWKHRKPQRGTA